MYMQLKKLFLAAFFTTLTTVGSAYAVDSSEPLMVVRFNQDYVQYEKQLGKAIDSALRVKPETFFDIVSLVPQTGDDDTDEKFAEESKYLTQQIVENIYNNGINADRVRVTYQNTKIIKNNEVQIFVR